jgi:hypothetical protein
MNLNITPETIAYGELPESFRDNACTGNLLYSEDGDGILIERDDVNAVDFSNIHLLNEFEREVLRQVNMFFALCPNVTQVILRPTY